MLPRPRKALLVVLGPAHFTELARLATTLSAHGWEPVLCFRVPYATRGEHVETARAAGWTVLHEPDAPATPLPPPPTVRDAVREALPGPLLSTYRAVRGLVGTVARPVLAPWRELRAARETFERCVSARRGQLAHAGALLDSVGPAIVALCEDNVALETSAWVRAAHERRVPAVVVPFTIAGAEEPAEALREQPLHQAGWWPNRLLLQLHPRWGHEHRGRRLVRLPAPEALALEHLGLAPDLPWILNSGRSDAIAVESEFMLQHYARCGLPASRLVITGAAVDDELAAGLRARTALRRGLGERLGFDASRPLMLCALPPDQFAGHPLPGVESGTYAELIRAMTATLLERWAGPVLFVRHPRHPADELEPLLAPGARLCDEQTAQLLPLADAYVACGSATVRWALACGLHVVNHDVYRYGYGDYRGIDTVQHVTTFAELGDAASRTAQLAAPAPAPRYGMLDGRSGERLVELFERLSADSARSSPAAARAPSAR
jgi:hypothetical protein